MGNNIGDKRGFIRVPFDTEVEIVCGDRSFRAETNVDISMSGIRIPLDGSERAEPGAVCRVSVILKGLGNRVAVQASGRVTRSEPRCLAVRYTELDPESYNHLRNLIVNNAEDPERAEREFEAHWGIKDRPVRPNS